MAHLLSLDDTGGWLGMLARGRVGIDPLGLEKRGPIVVVATLELGVQRKKKKLTCRASWR